MAGGYGPAASVPIRRTASLSFRVIGDCSVAEPSEHFFEGVEAVFDLDEGLRPLPGWKVVQKLGAPSSHIAISRDVANHATDDSAVEQKVVAASCEAVKRLGHQGPGA